MACSNKRAGDALQHEAPPSKRSNKENSFNSVSTGLDSQRRSVRDHSQQKTPLQQLEEISSVVSGISYTPLTSKNISPGILEDSTRNPMAPEAGRTKRRFTVTDIRKDSTQSSTSTATQPAALRVPDITMQEFASMVNGDTNVSNTDHFAYNLRLPTPMQTSEMMHTTRSRENAFPQHPSPRPDTQPPSSSRNVEGNDQLFDFNGNNAGLTFDFNFINSQPQYTQPQLNGSISGGNGDDAGFSVLNSDIGSTPHVVYNWLGQRQGPNVPSSDGSTFLEPDMTGLQGTNMYYGGNGTFWVNGDGYSSSNDDEHESTDDEHADSSKEETAIGQGLANANHFGNGSAIGTSSSQTFESSLSNALGTVSSTGSLMQHSSGMSGNSSSTGSAHNTSSMSNGAPGIVSQCLPPIATAQKGYPVLGAHYERNRRPRPPTVEKLRKAGSLSSHMAATGSAISHGPGHHNQNINSLTCPVSMASHSRAGGSSRSQQVSPQASPGVHPRGNLATSDNTSLRAGGRTASTAPGPSTGVASGNANSDEGESEIDKPPPRTKAPRFSKTPRASKTVEPNKSKFYPENWQIVLKPAKLLVRWWVATQVPFPNRRQHYRKMLEFLDRALEIHQSGGGYVKDGYYETHWYGMQKILWDEIANFRGIIKQLAREAIIGYNFKPENIEDMDVYKTTLIKNVRALLHDTAFLCNGVDANGSMNNFCHTNFCQTTLASFYSSYSKLASHFPEDFFDEVPRQAQALAATAVNDMHAFDEWLGGSHKTIKFLGREYARKLQQILDLMAKLEADPVQARTLQITRQVWARMGRNDTEDAGQVNNGFVAVL